jgi:hypothetical protein
MLTEFFQKFPVTGLISSLLIHKRTDLGLVRGPHIHERLELGL